MSFGPCSSLDATAGSASLSRTGGSAVSDARLASAVASFSATVGEGESDATLGALSIAMLSVGEVANVRAARSGCDAR